MSFRTGRIVPYCFGAACTEVHFQRAVLDAVWRLWAEKQELTPEIVGEFIDKVVVHDRSEPWKKKNYTQQVDVYFNFAGKV